MVETSSRRSLRSLLAAGVVGAIAALPAAAQAQDRVAPTNGEGMDTHLFRPAVDSRGFFATNGADIMGANDISFGLVLDYGRNLMRTNTAREPGVDPALDPGRGVDELIRHSFQGTLVFDYGIANLLVVGLSAPLLLMAGDEANQIGPTGGTYNSGKLDQQGFSTVALHAKLRLLRPDKVLGLALIGQVGQQLGDARKNLGGDPGTWYWPRVVVEKQIGRARRLKIGADLGYRGHTGENPRFGQDPQGRDQLASGRLQYGNLATYGVGASYRVLDPLDLIVETYGTYLVSGDSASKQKHSQELVGGIKLFLERNSFLMMGGGSRLAVANEGFQSADLRLFLGFVFEPSIGDADGDGLKDDVDQCPDQPEDEDGFKDEDGCPDPDNDNDGILDVDDQCPNTAEDRDGDRDDDGCPEGSDGDKDGDGILDSNDKCPDDPEDRDGFQDKDGCPEPDNDGDGILDKDDRCPNDPEDKDGFEDADGCPEPDNDRDQIPDVKDKCPNDPETYNGMDDADGCPDKGKVVIEGSDITILEKVQFKKGSAEILPESNEILDAVAAALKGHPEFLVVEIAGHADERSDDFSNLRLTRLRAASVTDALVARGISRSRLVSQGYGEYCPIDPAHNEAAWDKNRRVEFKIVKTEDGTTDAERGCDTARQKGVLPPPLP
jgi:OmpA-OmpF porin, OOP family